MKRFSKYFKTKQGQTLLFPLVYQDEQSSVYSYYRSKSNLLPTLPTPE